MPALPERTDMVLKKAGEIRDIRATIQGLKEGTLRPSEDVSDDVLIPRTALAYYVQNHEHNPFVIAREAQTDRTLWENLKEERNALVAIIIERVFGRMKTTLPELMLSARTSVRGEEFVRAFHSELSNYFTYVDSLTDDTPLAEKLREMTVEPFDLTALRQQRKLLDRYRVIVDFGVASDQWIFNSYSPFHSQFIMRGMRAADETMRNFMVMIPAILEREGIKTTSENIEQAARSSYPFFLQIASMNLVHGVSVLNALKRTFKDKYRFKLGFHDRFFSLDKNSLRIYMPRQTLARLRGPVKVLFRKILELGLDGVTTKCPASYAQEFFMTLFEYYLTNFMSVVWDNRRIEQEAIARMKR